MTLDLALVTELDDENTIVGDLKFVRGELVLVDGGDAIAQEIRVRLRWWTGEWFLDTAAGVPYLEQLLGKGISDATIREVLRREIEDVPGVAGVRSIEISTDRQTRFSTVDLDILTDDGVELELADVAVGGAR
jgi:hypothetical protein